MITKSIYMDGLKEKKKECRESGKNEILFIDWFIYSDLFLVKTDRTNQT